MSKKNREANRAQRTERAAAALAAQKRGERMRRVWTIGGVVVVVLAIVGVGWLVTSNRDDSTRVDADVAGSDFGLTVGPPAPKNTKKPDPVANTVIIYEDFLCPYCEQFESASRAGLSQLAADGKVRVEYRPIGFLNDYSTRAAAAFAVVLEKSDPQVAVAFHDKLFDNQPPETGDSFPSNDDLIDWAVEAGAVESDIRGPIEDGDKLQWVADATEAAKSAGVSSTPTILLNNEVFNQGRNQEDNADKLIEKLS